MTGYDKAKKERRLPNDLSTTVPPLCCDDARNAVEGYTFLYDKKLQRYRNFADEFGVWCGKPYQFCPFCSLPLRADPNHK